MALTNNAPIPAGDPIAQPHRPQYQGHPDPNEGLLTVVWLNWFTNLVQVVATGARRINAVPLTAQGGSIGATDITDGAANAGLYRVSWYAQITTPAGVSSSLTVTFTWTNRGVSQTESGAAITGNLTTTHQSGSMLIRVDQNSPINYSTTYVSVGAPAMAYSLDVTLESVQS